MHYCRHLYKIREIVKYEYCTVMKFLILEKQSANNYHERLTNVYGDSAPLYATITTTCTYVAVKRGRMSDSWFACDASRPLHDNFIRCLYVVDACRIIGE